MSIRTKLIVVLIPAILLLVGLLLFTNFSEGKKTVLKLINNEATEVARARVKQFDLVFESSKKIAEGIAISIGTMDAPSKENIELIIKKTLQNNKNIFGSTVSLLQDKTDIGSAAPYYFWKDNELKYIDLDTPSYNYQNKDWFIRPIKSGKGIWTSPYYDEGGGNILMITYATPIRNDKGIIGVATVDISINNIVEKVRNITVSGQGYAFIVAEDGKYIAFPGKGDLSKESLWDLAQKTKNVRLKEFASLLKKKKELFVEFYDPFKQQSSLLLSTFIDSIDWTLVIVYPKSEIFSPLYQLRDNNMIASGVIVVLIIVLIFWVSGSLTSPLTKFVEQTKHYSKGYLDVKLDDTRGSKEIRELASSFNTMGQAIIDHIENIKTTTAEKQKYEQELTIASEIQQSILPQTFPPFPELENIIDLYGLTRPARQIGGDYYDFFKLDDRRIAVVIADVSDKGAPSSFFMAMTRMLIREIAGKNTSPSEILRRTNFMLAQDNPHCMFVTLIYGEVDTKTGLVRFACAGHNPPVLLKTDGSTSIIKLKNNLPLGIMPDTHYKTDNFKLKPGEMIVLYTDGITEAMNIEEEQMGLAPFRDVLTQNKDKSTQEISGEILSSIDKYRGEMEQQDDITLLCLRLKEESGSLGADIKELREKKISLSLPAKNDVLETISNLTRSITKEIGFNDEAINQINLALDEVVSNVIMHAYPNGTDETFVIEFIPRSDGIKISVVDYGVPFDFDKKVDAYDSEEASVDQEIGGIGLFLAKKSVDEIKYEPNTADGNRLEIIKKF